MDKCVVGMMEATGKFFTIYAQYDDQSLYLTDCSIGETMEAASLHPAKLLEINDCKGSLEFGKDADFILLNDKLEVQATYIAGKNVWTHP